MKLKVKPEGRESVYLIEPDDLRAWLDGWFSENEYLHCFIADDNTSMFIGADWTRGDFDDHIDSREAQWAVVTMDDGTFAGHRLVCVDKIHGQYTRLVFDVGPISEKDLEVD